MTKLADLESRVRVLEDTETIKKLKFKYWRCVDGKRWDELFDCLAENAVAEYWFAGRFEGRKAILDFFRGSRADEEAHILRVHHGHNPEIELVNDTTAKGLWQLFCYRFDRQTNKGMRSSAIYTDTYAKQNGEWKIESTKTTCVFAEQFVGADVLIPLSMLGNS